MTTGGDNELLPSPMKFQFKIEPCSPRSFRLQLRGALKCIDALYGPEEEADTTKEDLFFRAETLAAAAAVAAAAAADPLHGGQIVDVVVEERVSGGKEHGKKHKERNHKEHNHKENMEKELKDKSRKHKRDEGDEHKKKKRDEKRDDGSEDVAAHTLKKRKVAAQGSATNIQFPHTCTRCNVYVCKSKRGYTMHMNKCDGTTPKKSKAKNKVQDKDAAAQKQKDVADDERRLTEAAVAVVGNIGNVVRPDGVHAVARTETPSTRTPLSKLLTNGGGGAAGAASAHSSHAPKSVKSRQPPRHHVPSRAPFRDGDSDCDSFDSDLGDDDDDDSADSADTSSSSSSGHDSSGNESDAEQDQPLQPVQPVQLATVVASKSPIKSPTRAQEQQQEQKHEQKQEQPKDMLDKTTSPHVAAGYELDSDDDLEEIA